MGVMDQIQVFQQSPQQVVVVADPLMDLPQTLEVMEDQVVVLRGIVEVPLLLGDQVIRLQ